MLLIGDGSGAGPEAGAGNGSKRGKSAATAMVVDGSDDDSGIEAEEFDELPSPFRIEMEAEASGFAGLVRVVVSVFEIDATSSSSALDERQLARLVALVPDGTSGVGSESPSGTPQETEDSP